jgi:hypothetical protein
LWLVIDADKGGIVPCCCFFEKGYVPCSEKRYFKIRTGRGILIAPHVERGALSGTLLKTTITDSVLELMYRTSIDLADVAG